jgi:hypothetical protein
MSKTFIVDLLSFVVTTARLFADSEYNVSPKQGVRSVVQQPNRPEKEAEAFGDMK